MWIENGSSKHDAKETIAPLPGDLGYIPKGVAYTFTNPSEEPAKAINVFAPSGLADFLHEVSDSVDAAASSQNVGVNTIAGRHELKLIGAPLAAMMANGAH